MENTKSIGEKSICESCGKEFFCGANVEKCWCFAVELKTETLAELRDAFKRCLCENCLEEFAVEMVIRENSNEEFLKNN